MLIIGELHSLRPSVGQSVVGPVWQQHAPSPWTPIAPRSICFDLRIDLS